MQSSTTMVRPKIPIAPILDVLGSTRSPRRVDKILPKNHYQRTGSKFNAVILKWLFMSKVSKPPISLSSLIRFTEGKGHEVPPLKVMALRFTETARARIEKAGGECLTFGQHALQGQVEKGVAA
ncbi:60S ribosomal protein L18 [Actinidia rufa]|uniref:60S ribosomal protein L18 n=1 Tax=Actinidia rufa TaxID=165716 RepID=A0A7J0H295_9ERIC|nr:60S ribosomal protein L18 [Actinidia rufa]